jgi:shikimate dehydrogenase
MRDSRETFVNHAFVAGWPIRHSRSPLIHTYWLKSLGLSGRYTAQEVSPDAFPDFVQAVKSGVAPFVGGNVTIPHKETVLLHVDAADALSLELGAANTIWREEGRLKATNTDGVGFAANLDERAPGWHAVDTAVILGAGGASRAVIQAVRDRGVRTVHVVNRTLPRARELSDRFGADRVFAHSFEALPELLSEAGLFINTTSLGMDGTAAPAFDFTVMPEGALVTDIVYTPLITPILVQARDQGLRIVDGLGMLLHQAAPGFETWFGKRPMVDEALRDLVIADMEHHA